MRIIKELTELVGNTPIIDITGFRNSSANLFAKLEMTNPLSSVKDRVALAMVERAEREGRIHPGDTLIEPTSGNTGISLAFIAASRGYKLILTMPETMSIERRKLLRALGAEVVLTDPDAAMDGALQKAVELSDKLPGSFIPQQFSNLANPDVHMRTTAEEIWKDMDGKIDIFVAGVGTGGTLTGVGEILKKRNPGVRIVAVEPFQSSVLSGKGAALHRIQGIGAGFVPDVMNMEIVDEILRVRDDDAGDAAREIAKKKGIPVGISSGAVLWAALQLAERPENNGKNIVTVFPDSGERYLSTWLYEDFSEEAKIGISGTDAEAQSDPALMAQHYFNNGLSCSESVLKSLNEAYALGLPENCYKIATAFGSGMGESGCACGAVTACTMIFGLMVGRNKAFESNRLAYLAANELQKRFKSSHRAICCRVLTKGVEWKSAEHKLLCDQYVHDAAKLTVEIIETQLEPVNRL
jgi:cysteine synthase A